MPGDGFDDEATFNVDDELLEQVRAAATSRSGEVDDGEVGAGDLPEIDGYTQLREIGRGGFSRVFEALQVEFDRWVAVKVLNQPIIDAGHIAEFERECRLMGNLSRHPNIVSVHASAFTADRRPCIVMELFSHGSYQNILNHTGPLALEELLSLSVLMAGALATAHQRGVIHGDVKPQNIFRSEYNTPALGDFGIAALADAAGDTDKLRASAHYAAPELIEQGPTVSTAAADQYSLGATIYTLATGQRPHAADSTQTTTELLQRVLVEPAPRLEAGFPASLANALHKAMAREPQQRHRDLVAFAAAIARTQQELGFQPTEIPVGAQQARYMAATPQPAAPQDTSTGPTPTGGHTESTVSLASKEQDSTRTPSGAAEAGRRPPGGDQPPSGSEPRGVGAGGSRKRFPRWAKIVSTAAVVAAIAIVAAVFLIDSGEEGDVDVIGDPVDGPGAEGSEPIQTSEPEEPEPTKAPEPEEPEPTKAPEPEDPESIEPPPNDLPAGEPSLAGKAEVGETLTADVTGISDGNGIIDETLVYQWVRVAADGAEALIPGQSSSSYIVTDIDAGHRIVVRISFTDQNGYEEGPLSSSATAPVRRRNVRAEGVPVIAGTAWVGQRLTAATLGIVDANEVREESFTYQWVRVAPDGTETVLGGQTASTYEVSAADPGYSFKVRVSFIDEEGYEEGPLESAAIAVGAQIAFHSDRSGALDVFIANANGSEARQLTSEEGNNFDPSLSPDGTRVVFITDRHGGSNHEIYVMEVDGSNEKRLTNNNSSDGDPSWSPDGTQIAFTTNRYGNFEIAVINADGSSGERAERLTTTSHQDRAPQWSPDGTKIVFIHNFGGDFEVGVMDLDNQNRVATLTSYSGDDEDPVWSNDGSKIAFSRGRLTTWGVLDFDIWMMDADGSGKVRVYDSSTTDKSPVWSPGDSMIAYHRVRSNPSDIEIILMDADPSDPDPRILIDSSGRDWMGSWS